MNERTATERHGRRQSCGCVPTRRSNPAKLSRSSRRPAGGEHVRAVLLFALLLGGCQFLFEPKPEPRYRWVAFEPRGGGYWKQDPQGSYVWAGKDFVHVVSIPEPVTLSKRWRAQ